MPEIIHLNESNKELIKKLKRKRNPSIRLSSIPVMSTAEDSEKILNYSKTELSKMKFSLLGELKEKILKHIDNLMGEKNLLEKILAKYKFYKEDSKFAALNNSAIFNKSFLNSSRSMNKSELINQSCIILDDKVNGSKKLLSKFIFKYFRNNLFEKICF